jgi:hypothetical protein
MGNVPQFTVDMPTTLLNPNSANIGVSTVQQGNVIDGGSFTLSFASAITAPIPFNADPATMRSALEALATIDSVNVQRSAPDFQVPLYIYALPICRSVILEFCSFVAITASFRCCSIV